MAAEPRNCQEKEEGQATEIVNLYISSSTTPMKRIPAVMIAFQRKKKKKKTKGKRQPTNETRRDEPKGSGVEVAEQAHPLALPPPEKGRPSSSCCLPALVVVLPFSGVESARG